MSGEEPRTKLPPDLLEQARYLRKNQTEAEELLWQLLRNRQLNGAKFRRQHPVKEGVIIDFYCHASRLAVEVDGGYHETEEQQASDKERTNLLNDMGIQVIRFWNKEVLEETERVLEEIARELDRGSQSPRSPHSGSLPGGERMEAALPPEADESSPNSPPPPTPPSSPLGRGHVSPQAERGEGETRDMTFTHIYNAIHSNMSLEEANDLVNSITICDPAVGSGHFLVSCLNELLAIKSELDILCDTEGKLLHGVDVRVVNDELIVKWRDDELFEYDVAHTWNGKRLSERKIAAERQRIQKALFHEKRHLIENCLFGVDINPNSVKICRLRLWIELLKNAYYTEESHYHELEVLPNIDINIKSGNSLVSRFDLDTGLEDILKKTDYTLEDYRKAVADYKETRDPEGRRELKQLIKETKEAFSVGLEQLHPERRKLKELEARLIKEETQHDMFGDDIEEGGSRSVRIKDLQKKIEKQRQVVDDLEAGTFYRHAFEWRFEFPEVLDTDGRFMGFDVVIGNPPYIRQEQLKDLKDYLKEHYNVYQGTADLYSYFIERGMNLLREGGIFHYIVSNKWMRANYGKPLREWMQHYQIESIIDFGDLPVFEEATVYPCLLLLRKFGCFKNFEAAEVEHLDFELLPNYLVDKKFEVDQSKLQSEGWTLIDKRAQQLLEKIKQTGTPLKEYVKGEIYRGILTGLNKAFVIDEETKKDIIARDPKSSELLKPFLAGRDIKRYQPPSTDKYLILIPSGWTNKQTDEENKWDWFCSEFPSISGHLAQFEDKARKRYDQGEYWWELRSCDYYEEFEKPKILWPGISSVVTTFGIDENNLYGNDNIHLIVSDDKFLLGLLNSTLSELYLKSICDFVQARYYRMKISYIETVPIQEPSNKLKTAIESLVDQIFTTKRDDPGADTSKPEAEIDRLVYELYGLSEEEVGIVEGSVSG